MIYAQPFLNSGYQIEITGSNATVMGVSNGFPFSVSIMKAAFNKYSISFATTIDRKLTSPEIKALRSSMKAAHIVSRMQNPFVIVLSLSRTVAENDIYSAAVNLINFSSGFLANYNIPPKSTCPICKNGGCDCTAYTAQSGLYSYAHLACVQNNFSKQVASANKMNSGSVFLGIIGAILGTFVGSLPNILTIALFNRVYVWLFFIIPLAGFFGYKLLHGKVNKATGWIISIFSILSVFNIEVLSLYFVSLAQGGGYSLFDVLIIYILLLITGSEPSIYVDLVLTLIFTVIGIVFTWKAITVTPSTAVDNAVSQKRTVRMLDGSIPEGMPISAPAVSQPAYTQQPVQPAYNQQAPFTPPAAQPTQPVQPAEQQGSYSTLPENMQE